MMMMLIMRTMKMMINMMIKMMILMRGRCKKKIKIK